MLRLTTDKKELENYLKAKGWMSDEESIHTTERPGEGNMNFTLRIDTGSRTFIIKQSRDYVEKFPQVAAPKERALQEAHFYQFINEKEDLSAMMPVLKGIDEENSIIMMDDLGEGSDYTFLYQEGKSIPEKELLSILDFAISLHSQFKVDAVKDPIRNREMRKLNHEHMFIYPYVDDNGLDLNQVVPGLKEVASSFKQDAALKMEIEKMGDLYLKDGDSLLHGDYFPGSWLNTKQGVKIIDPEFCFFGPPEFEIGIMIAHLKMADQPQALIDKAISYYQSKATLDTVLQEKFTATEILRRILGLAQLPLEIDLNQRKNLLEEARAMLSGK